MIRWSTTARMTHRCCSASTKRSPQIAHGYARAKGKPMIAIVHNLVGLLHAPMGIYYAYLDRAPVFIVGATGPMAEPKRRPFIDWIHTANGQGEVIRNFVKWDYQPTTVDGVPGAFARAYSVMMSARQDRSICVTMRACRKRSWITTSKCRRRRDRRSRSSGRGSRVGEGGQYSGHRQSSSDNRRFRRPSAARLEACGRAGGDSGRLGVGRAPASTSPAIIRSTLPRTLTAATKTWMLC